MKKKKKWNLSNQNNNKYHLITKILLYSLFYTLHRNNNTIEIRHNIKINLVPTG